MTLRSGTLGALDIAAAHPHLSIIAPSFPEKWEQPKKSRTGLFNR